MFCTKCGAPVPEGTSFCPNCGMRSPCLGEGRAFSPMVVYNPKNNGTAVILSILFTGFGTIYAGRIVRGILLFLAQVICIGSSTTIYNISIDLEASGNPSISPLVALIVFSAIILILWSIGVVDAYATTRGYNQKLVVDGQPPW